MKRVLFAAVCWGMLLSMGEARAAVVCGPGTHASIASNEVPDYSFCLPDENLGDEDDRSDANPPAEPVWETRWGAIATGDGAYGAALQYPNEQAARERASSECQARTHGQPCRVRLTFRDQCAALAGGDAGSVAFSAATEERATALAIKRCAENTAHCRILYSGCSLPERSQ